MYQHLTKERFLELAKQYDKIAIHRIFPADKITPISVCDALGQQLKGASLLETAPDARHMGRYSFLGFNPFVEFRAHANQITLRVHDQTSIVNGNPFEQLRHAQQKYRYVTDHSLSGFAGGLVGYIGHQAIHHLETIPNKFVDDEIIPDMIFKAYQHHVCFDLKRNQVALLTLLDVNDSPEIVYEQGLKKLDHLFECIHRPTKAHAIPDKITNNKIKTDVEDNLFFEKVTQAQKHIKQGNIFQVVLSRHFQCEYTANPLDIYRVLRIKTPSPYMFYLDYDNFSLVGSSPEKLISVKNDIVEVCPIAGTRKRNPENEEAIINELLADKKENAEHMMLVDLARNDLGAICKAGSIKVTQLKSVQLLSHVIHLSSLVEGVLEDNKDAIDAFCSAFPAGTLSGAPKIRALEIINELEASKRQVYGGGIVFLDNQGQLDSCIAIRMALLQNTTATVRAGAGVVHDSLPTNEAEETKHKAQCVLDAIAIAQGGLSC